MAEPLYPARACPTCGQAVKAVPARADRLPHYYCGDCGLFWFAYNGDLNICEQPELHVAFYADYKAGVRV